MERVSQSGQSYINIFLDLGLLQFDIKYIIIRIFDRAVSSNRKCFKFLFF